MGYTHFFSAGPNTSAWLSSWPQLIADAQLIIDNADVELCSGGYDPSPPLVDVEKGIILNGANGGLETFILRRELEDFDFCTTLRYPYDAVVTTLLLRASMLAKDGIVVGSDGDWEEWEEAQKLYKRLWPEEEPIVCPWVEAEAAAAAEAEAEAMKQLRDEAESKTTH